MGTRLGCTLFNGRCTIFGTKRSRIGDAALFRGVFGLAYYLTVKQSGLMKWVGKYLNPLFLALLLVVLVLALVMPMGNTHQAVSATYQAHAGFQGILDGYNTMDGIALLALAVSVVYAVKALGFRDAQVSRVLAKAGLLSIVAEAVLYTALVLLGVTSLGQFKAAANGGDAFAQIVAHYAGNFGTALTGVVVTLAVFTTAMGLFVSFAQDMHLVFPKVSYLWFLRVIAFGSFVTANAGLTNIVAWSVPVLMFLYPLSLVLIMLSLTAKYFDYAPVVYRSVVGFVALPAHMMLWPSSPFMSGRVAQQVVNTYHQLIPFSALGFGWLVPAVVGAVVGLGAYSLAQMTQKSSVTVKVDESF